MSNPPAKQKALFESLTEYGESALDNGWLPDAVLRPVIGKLNRVRLNEIDKGELQDGTVCKRTGETRQLNRRHSSSSSRHWSCQPLCQDGLYRQTLRTQSTSG